MVISEIMFHPISGDEQDSYVELHNTGTNALDVGYWAFIDGIDMVFPEGTIIPAGGFLVVAQNVTNPRPAIPN